MKNRQLHISLLVSSLLLLTSAVQAQVVVSNDKELIITDSEGQDRHQDPASTYTMGPNALILLEISREY